MKIPVPDLLAAWRDLGRGRDELPVRMRDAIAGRREVKIPYLVSKPGSNGPRRFWQPGPALAAAGWPAARLPDNLALAAIDALARHDEVEAWRAAGCPAVGARGGGSVKPGTFSDLVERYKRDRRYAALTERGRKDYDWLLRELEKTFGDSPLSVITPARANRYIGGVAARTPRKAARLAFMANRLFALAPKLYDEPAILAALPAESPFARPGISSKRATEPRLWPEAAVQAVVEAADEAGWPSIGTAVAVNEWAGLNRGDLLALPASAHAEGEGGGELYGHRHKTGQFYYLPLDMVPHLARRLAGERARQRAAAVTATTLIVCDSTGRPWAGDYFNQVFRETVLPLAAKKHPDPIPVHPEFPHLGEVRIKDLKFRWLRHTACTRYLAAGVAATHAAWVLGWKVSEVLAIAETYRLPAPDAARTAFGQRLAHMDAQRAAGNRQKEIKT